MYTVAQAKKIDLVKKFDVKVVTKALVLSNFTFDSHTADLRIRPHSTILVQQYQVLATVPGTLVLGTTTVVE